MPSSICRGIVNWVKLVVGWFRLLLFTQWQNAYCLRVNPDLKNFRLKYLLLLLFLTLAKPLLLRTEKIIYFYYVSFYLSLDVDSRSNFCELIIIFSRFYATVILIGPDYSFDLAYFALSVWLEFRHVQSLIIFCVNGRTIVKVHDRIHIVYSLKMLQELILFLW